MSRTKRFSLFVLICLFAVGCTHEGNPSTGENGNGLGGGNVAGSFTGSSGAESKAATGSSQAAPSTDPGSH